MTIKIIATGGTIDKLYFDAKSAFQVGDPTAPFVLEEAKSVWTTKCRVCCARTAWR